MAPRGRQCRKAGRDPHLGLAAVGGAERLDEAEIETVRGKTATFKWTYTAEEFLKTAEELAKEGKKKEAESRFRAIDDLPGASPLKDRAMKALPAPRAAARFANFWCPFDESALLLRRQFYHAPVVTWCTKRCENLSCNTKIWMIHVRPFHGSRNFQRHLLKLIDGHLTRFFPSRITFSCDRAFLRVACGDRRG